MTFWQSIASFFKALFTKQPAAVIAPPKPQPASPVPAPISAPVAVPAGNPHNPPQHTWDGTSEVLGVDTAHYQDAMGSAEWKDLFAKGFRWMYPKATDGSGPLDSYWAKSKAFALDAGFLCFAGYCFSRYSTDPKVQAANLVTRAGGVKSGELPFVLDVEWDNSAAEKARYGDGKEMDSACEEHTYACLSEIERLSGVTPWIYTSAGFFKALNPARFARFPVIIANYSKTTTDGKIALPKPWTLETARQYSGSLSEGAAGEIDGDRFLGTLDQLKAYQKK